MAKINGIEIKNLKSFMGMEGPTLQGDIWYKGKKLGFWSQDGNGGPDWYDFDATVLDDEVKKYYGEDSYYDLDCLLYDVVNLKDDEKQYKKFAKNGYKIMATLTDGYHLTYYAYADLPKEREDALKVLEPKIKAFKDTVAFKNKDVEVRLYYDIADFNQDITAKADKSA